MIAFVSYEPSFSFLTRWMNEVGVREGVKEKLKIYRAQDSKPHEIIKKKQEVIFDF